MRLVDFLLLKSTVALIRSRPCIGSLVLILLLYRFVLLDSILLLSRIFLLSRILLLDTILLLDKILLLNTILLLDKILLLGQLLRCKQFKVYTIQGRRRLCQNYGRRRSHL